MTLEQTKQAALGKWESITPEVRPGNTKNPDGTLKPFYLSRKFTFLPNDQFELTVTNFADPYGKLPLAKMEIKGHAEWKGEHPIAAGARKNRFHCRSGIQSNTFAASLCRCPQPVHKRL